MEVVAEGLAFPEGPVVMADGSVIVVEIMGGRITRCWDGKTETVCEIGGGPNGAAIGPDGALWVCNSGGLWMSPPVTEGRIERVDLSTGKFERVCDSCDGIPLEAPNDLAFDSSGRLWFTDFGTLREDGKEFGGLFTCLADGSGLTAVKRGALSYNGVGLSPDESHVWVADSFSARLYRFDPRPEPQTPQWIATAQGEIGFDSLAITEAGNICVATIHEGGILTITPTGEQSMTPIAGEEFVTNIAFGGEDMRDAWITLSGTGKLIRMRWDEAGLKLPFNA